MKKLTISFDIEEFDTPLEHDANIDFERQMSISVLGTTRILDLLKKKGIKATFFCTANFADHAKDILLRIVNEGHELASHGYYHSRFDVPDLLNSRLRLEELSGQKIIGYRMARMMPISNANLKDAGYTYNASLNPTFIPGRYNNLGKSRLSFIEDGLFQIPASVTSILRIPLFWLSFHNFPFGFYYSLLKGVIKKENWANIYFHPWEFADIEDEDLKLPKLITRNSGKKMCDRFDKMVSKLLDEGVAFETYGEYMERTMKQS